MAVSQASQAAANLWQSKQSARQTRQDSGAALYSAANNNRGFEEKRKNLRTLPYRPTSPYAGEEGISAPNPASTPASPVQATTYQKTINAEQERLAELAFKQKMNRERIEAEMRQKSFRSLPPTIAAAGEREMEEADQAEIQEMQARAMEAEDRIERQKLIGVARNRAKAESMQSAAEAVLKTSESFDKMGGKVVKDWIWRIIGRGSTIDWPGETAWIWTVVGYITTGVQFTYPLLVKKDSPTDKKIRLVIARPSVKNPFTWVDAIWFIAATMVVGAIIFVAIILILVTVAIPIALAGTAAYAIYSVASYYF